MFTERSLTSSTVSPGNGKTMFVVSISRFGLSRKRKKIDKRKTKKKKKKTIKKNFLINN